MENNNNITPSFFDRFSQIIIVECICIALIIISIFIIKSFFKKTYNKLDVWYKENICVDTDLNEVITDGESNEV